jgi:hypothetical protein
MPLIRKPLAFVLDEAMISKEKKNRLDSECRTYVVGRGKRTGHEHLTGYQATDGKRLGSSTSQKPDAVAFPYDMLRLALNKRSKLVVHHNHPRGTSLSREDLFNLYRYPGTMEVHAHGHSKQWYLGSTKRERRFEQLIHVADQAFFSCLYNEITLGEIPTCLENHLFNLGLAHAGVLNYEFRLDRVMQNLYNQIKHQTTHLILKAIYQAIEAERSRR